MKLDPDIIPVIKSNLKDWMKDLNVRSKTVKLEGDTGKKLLDIGQNKQVGLNQTKKFLHCRANNKQNEKGTHRMEENICKLSAKELSCMCVCVCVCVCVCMMTRIWKQPKCPSINKWIKSCGAHIQWNMIQQFKK